MPNNPKWDLRGDGYHIEVKTAPQGVRKFWLLRWVPYWTGCKVGITVGLEVKEGPSLSDVSFLFIDHKEIARGAPVVAGSSTRAGIPSHKTGLMYLARPGEGAFQLDINSPGKSPLKVPVYDFSVFAKDRLRAWLLVALGATALGIANLVVNLARSSG